MKWIAGIMIGTLLCLSGLSFVVRDGQIKKMEDRLQYSVGLASVAKSFDFSEEKGNGKVAFEEENTHVVFAENGCEGDSSVWSFGGRYTQTFEQEKQEIYQRIKSRYSVIEGENWSALGSVRLESPPEIALNNEELAYLCKKIVGSCASSVPITGELNEIAFVNQENSYVFARIRLCLKDFSEIAHVAVLPEQVTFSVLIPIICKNSEKSVDCKNIQVNCETMDIPELLLTYGCYLLFGQKDYKGLLGGIFANILYNAGICT